MEPHVYASPADVPKVALTPKAWPGNQRFPQLKTPIRVCRKHGLALVSVQIVGESPLHLV